MIPRDVYMKKNSYIMAWISYFVIVNLSERLSFAIEYSYDSSISILYVNVFNTNLKDYS